MKKHFLIILFLLFYFAVITYKLITYPTPFYDWDEAIYAQVGKEMIKKKSLVPLWQGQNWLDKPPLTPLAYGIIENITLLPPEISTRIFTLILSIVVLTLVYVFYYRLTKNVLVAGLTVIITSFTPIFLQRAQVLNVDVFLFLGWMGYLVFYNNFWLSFLFLIIGVLSKSLLGFYPALGLSVILTILLYLKQINKKTFKKQIWLIIIQVVLASLWYFIMLVNFKFAFIKAQFLETMLKRVTASIESHFGRRTFYFDVLIEQLKWFFYLSIISLIFIIKEIYSVLNKKVNKKISITNHLLSIFFVPWFLFLNLTKTKISWYLYPVITQFAFLGVYFLSYINKKSKLITILLATIITIIILNQAFKGNKFFTTFYSSYDQYYQLSVYASKNCSQINLLVDKATRETYDTLNRMGLTISTTSWWGNHPSIVYYFGKKVNFIYNINDFNRLINQKIAIASKDCFVLTEEDKKYLTQKFKLLKKFKELNLFIK